MSNGVAAALFRTCPVTNLRVHRDAEALIKVNAVVAIVAFLVGVIAAILIVLTRWQAVHLLPAEWYYRLVTAHGLNMLIFFIIFFEMAILYFAGPVLLNCRLPTPVVGWLAFVLMVVGALTVDYYVFSGQADVMFTSYVPLRAHPGYYVGIILFAVGALIVVGLFFVTLLVARRERTYEGSMPLVVFGAMTAAVIAVFTLAHGAAIYIPTLLWSLGYMNVDPQAYRLVWWALGHASQQINVAAMVSVWYLMGGLTLGAMVLNEKVSRVAFLLYILFINLASAHHLLVDPGVGPAWKVWNTSYALYLAVLASMIHGFTVPAGMEIGMRLRGYTKGLFEWLRRAPWSDPGFSATFLSLIIFGFLGGVTGVVIGTEQINIIAHNTLRITGHFHATVVGGTSLAFMALTYYVIPLFFRRDFIWRGLARAQPWLFGGGILLVSFGMSFAGSMGVPRRIYDIDHSGAYGPAAHMMLAVMGVGAIIAVTGLLLFVVLCVGTILFGEKNHGRAMADWGTACALAGAREGSLADDHWAMRGTIALTAVFLACFAVYYFANWKALADVWPVR
jgi:cytochrome c oxidase subunit 1